MAQTPIRGIPPNTSFHTLDDDELVSLWSMMVRHRDAADTNALLRKEREPESEVEARIVALGERLAERDLFKGACLI